MSNLMERINKVYDLWGDEISRNFFEERINFKSAYHDNCNEDILFKMYDQSCIPEIEKIYDHKRRFVILGAGVQGKKTLFAMRHAKYDVEYFVDSDELKCGRIIDGVPVISIVDLCLEHKDLVAVIANENLGSIFFKILNDYGFPVDNIMYFPNGCLVNTFGQEYFDFPIHISGKKEIFFDVGAFDGKDSVSFINWCNDEYDKIYAFEPSEIFKLLQNNLNNIRNAVSLNFAIGENSGQAKFNINFNYPAASHIDDKGNKTVDVKTIDSLIQKDIPTFIKMDIEGAELEAIKGAQKVIKYHKPVLAISAYHKDTDLIELPLFINKLVPEYNLYLRHYTNSLYDLVLYAIP